MQKVRKKVSLLLAALFVLTAVGIPQVFAADLQAALDAIELTFAAGDTAESVTQNFDLPVSDATGTVAFNWSSSDPDAIYTAYNKAVVNQTFFDRTVKLTVEASDGTSTATKDFTVVVANNLLEPLSYIVNEDFERVEDVASGTGLPADANNVTWRQETRFNTSNNPVRGVTQDSDGNKMLTLSNLPSSGQNYVVATFPETTNTNAVVFDYRVKSLNSTTFHNFRFVIDSQNRINQFDGTMGVSAPVGLYKEKIEMMYQGASNVEIAMQNDTWLNVKLVMNPTLSTVSVYYETDGRWKLERTIGMASNASARTVNKMFIGGVNETGAVMLDDLKIYQVPENPTLINLEAIDVASTMGTDNLATVIDDLTLSTTISDANVTWISTNSAVLSEDGTVTRPDLGSNVTVKLYAILEKNGVQTVKTFDVTVLSNMTDEEKVAWDVSDIQIPTVVMGDLDMKAEGTYGSSIAWTSSDESIIAKDGTVTRGEEDKTIYLTATISAGSVSEVLEYTVFVPKATTSDLVTYPAAFCMFVRTQNRRGGNAIVDPLSDTANQRHGYMQVKVKAEEPFGSSSRYFLNMTWTGGDQPYDKNPYVSLYGMDYTDNAIIASLNTSANTTPFDDATKILDGKDYSLMTGGLLLGQPAVEVTKPYKIDVTSFVRQQILAQKDNPELVDSNGNVTISFKLMGPKTGKAMINTCQGITVERALETGFVSKPEFSVGGTTIGELTDGNVTAKFSVANMETTAFEGTAYVALYNNGRLEDIVLAPVSVNAFSISNEISVDFSVADATNRSVKIMVWDNDMKTSIPAYQFTKAK